MPPMTSITLIILFSNFANFVLCPILFPGISFDTNPQTGLFGFIYYEDPIYVIFAFGFMSGAVIYATYGYVLDYFSPVTLCTAFLFEPFISQIIGCLMGLDKSPGITTVLGTLITLAGLYWVGVRGMKKD